MTNQFNIFYKLLARIFKHELITGSFYLFLGGILASALSFIFNLFLARTLSYADYGIYISLLSLFAVLTVPSTIFIVTLVRFATTYFSRNDEQKAAHLYKKASIFLGFVAIVIFVFVASLSHLIQLYLHIDDIRLILLVGLAVSLTYFGVVNTAYLRSLMKFSHNAFNLIMGNLSKVFLGGVLVLFGYSVSGALVGVLVVPLVIVLLGYIPLHYLFKKNNKNKKIKIDSDQIISYAVPTTITLIALSSFIATDVILVRHFFSAEDAGIYGGISIIGKVIFYLIVPVSAVMFPVVVKRYTKKQEYKNVFYLSLILVTIPSALITVFYYLFPDFTINLFLGGRRYLEGSQYLWLFGVFIMLYSLLNVTVNFYLSIKKYIVAFLVPIFAVLQVVLIYLFHDNFYNIIYVSIFSVGAILFILWLDFANIRNKLHSKR